MKTRGVLFLLGLVYSTSVYAQAVIGFGTVGGTIRDPTGDGVPDTSVILSSASLGVRRVMTTTDDGFFNAPAMPPGPGYRLKVTRKGFVDWESDSFEVQLGHTLTFEISLQAAPGSAQDTAKKASVQIEDTGYGLSESVPQSLVDTLPSKNRSVDTLAALSPAVTVDSASGDLAFHSEPSTNAFWTDGILTTNTHFYQESDMFSPATQDFIQEMQVVSITAPPEFGHTLGGSMNIVTPSGTNAIHANAYDYFNDHSLNATDRYAPGFDPSGWQHQFGGNAGGPIFQDKMFWFVSLDDIDGHFAELNRTSNPLIVSPAGTSVLPSNCTATAAQCASAIAFLNAQLNRVVSSSLSSLNGFAKIDYRLSDSNSFNVEVNAAHRHSPNGADTETAASNAGVLGSNGTYTDESRYAKIGWTSVWSANDVNEIRAGSVHDRFSNYSDPQLLPSTGALGIDIAGAPFGGNPENPFVISEQRYQLVDNFSLTHNAHSIKLGVDYSNVEDRTDQVFDSAGTYFYPTLTTFAEDFNTSGPRHYTNFTQTFGQPVVDLHPDEFRIYAQDSWKATPDLTVVYGLDWERSIIPQPTYTNSIFFQTGSIHSTSLDFAPHLGVAYQVNDRTVIRLGVGRYFQPFSGQLLDALFTGNGIYQASAALNPTQSNAPEFPKMLGSATSIPAGGANVVYASDKFRNPYSIQSTVAVEHRLTNRLTLSADYLNDRGVGLWTAAEQNLNTPTITKTYLIEGASGNIPTAYSTLIYTTKSNANVAHVYSIGNEGASEYNGLAVQLRARLFHGVTAQASYTWSHAIDDVNGSPIIAGFIPATSFPGQFRGDQGNSSFDQRHRLVANWTWQPTVSKSDSTLSRYLLNGWQLSGIVTLASSLPETALVIVNGQQFTGTTMAFTNSLNGSGGWSRVPFDSVNGLPTGAEFDVDARLTRDLPFTERVKGMLMFEAFNAFNTQYDTSVNTIAYLATSGVLAPVPRTGAGNAADGFPWGSNARRLQVAFRVAF